MGRLMAIPKILHFKYAIWADLCPNFYTSNMPYGQTYVPIFIIQICLMGRPMPKFLYIKYTLWADLLHFKGPNFYTLNMPYGQLMSKFLHFKYAVWADSCPIFILQICLMARLVPNFFNFKII